MRKITLVLLFFEGEPVTFICENKEFVVFFSRYETLAFCSVAIFKHIDTEIYIASSAKRNFSMRLCVKNQPSSSFYRPFFPLFLLCRFPGELLEAHTQFVR